MKIKIFKKEETNEKEKEEDFNKISNKDNNDSKNVVVENGDEENNGYYAPLWDVPETINDNDNGNNNENNVYEKIGDINDDDGDFVCIPEENNNIENKEENEKE